MPIADVAARSETRIGRCRELDTTCAEDYQATEKFSAQSTERFLRMPPTDRASGRPASEQLGR